LLQAYLYGTAAQPAIGWDSVIRAA